MCLLPHVFSTEPYVQGCRRPSIHNRGHNKLSAKHICILHFYGVTVTTGGACAPDSVAYDVHYENVYHHLHVYVCVGINWQLHWTVWSFLTSVVLLKKWRSISVWPSNRQGEVAAVTLRLVVNIIVNIFAGGVYLQQWSTPTIVHLLIDLVSFLAYTRTHVYTHMHTNMYIHRNTHTYTHARTQITSILGQNASYIPKFSFICVTNVFV